MTQLCVIQAAKQIVGVDGDHNQAVLIIHSLTHPPTITTHLPSHLFIHPPQSTIYPSIIHYPFIYYPSTHSSTIYSLTIHSSIHQFSYFSIISEQSLTQGAASVY